MRPIKADEVGRFNGVFGARPNFGTLRAICLALGPALEDVTSFPARANLDR